MKNVKKVGMGGFMCRSPASTSVCTTGEFSVIVPKRHAGRSSSMVDHSMLMTTSSSTSSNYSRLVESRRRSVSLGDKRSVTLSSALLRDREHERERDRITSRPRSAYSVASAQPGFQEVVMRVSIHCQGCAGKIKKHLSKLEGVTSFSIDVEAKRVTVMGHISPVGVLESISKVKKAEFWPCSQLF